MVGRKKEVVYFMSYLIDIQLITDFSVLYLAELQFSIFGNIIYSSKVTTLRLDACVAYCEYKKYTQALSFKHTFIHISVAI